MAVTTPTSVAAVVPERWELNVLKARYAKEVIASRMLSASETNLQFGDIYHFPVADSLTGGTVSANGDFDSETLDPVDNTVTVNTWRYVSFEILWNTKRQ